MILAFALTFSLGVNDVIKSAMTARITRAPSEREHQ
jgi:hypothetical protein